MTSSSHEGHRLVRNLMAVIAGQILGAILNIIIIVAIARYLGVEQYGHYAYVLAFVGVFQLFASAGLDQILVREIAINIEDASRLLGIAKSLVWTLSLLTFVVIVAATQLTGTVSEIRLATYIVGAGAIATIHAICLSAVFRAFENMEVNAAGFVLHKVVFLGLVFVGAWANQGLLGMCGALALANAFIWGYYLAILTRRYFRPHMRVNLRLWWALLAESFPLGIAAILRRVSWQVGVLLLVAFNMTAAAGYFSAAYKVIEALNLIPLTLAQVLFPLLSRMARSHIDRFEEVVRFALKYLLFLSLPLAIGLAIAASRIVELAYGPAFGPASLPLVVTSLSLVFVFETSVYPFIFTAMGTQRYYIIAVLTGLVTNVFVDVALIPHLAQLGASIGALSAEAVLFGVGSLFLKRLNQQVSWVSSVWRPLLAGLAMSVPLWAVRRAALPVFILGALVSVVLYVGLLVALRAIRPDEIAPVTAQFHQWLRSASSAAVMRGSAPRAMRYGWGAHETPPVPRVKKARGVDGRPSSAPRDGPDTSLS